jgi:hypothetical protein
MDPSTTLMAVAQIFSLMADYAASKGAREQLDIHDFTQWLATQGHSDVMRAIEQNQTTLVSIKAALAEGRNELLERLADLDRKFSAVAAGAGPLSDLAQALHPNSVLSEQAQALLRAMEEQQVETMIEVSHSGGKQLLMAGGTSDNKGFEITDPRFYDDDINTLCALGMLSLNFNAKGGKYFRPTRLGAQVGRRLIEARNGR